MKAIKWIIATFTALALLLTIALAYIFFAIDPNSYKPQLTELAKEQDIILNIEGELNWQLLPSLALSIGATDITSPRADIPAISFEQADLSLAWLPLFKRQISVNAIHVEGADIRLGTAEQAINTATAPLAAAPQSTNQAVTTSETADTAETTPAFSLAIESLEISNSRLQLPATDSATSHQQLSDINLQIQDLNLDGEVFKLKANFNYTDPALPQPVAVRLDTEASVEQNTQALSLSNTALELLLADKPPVELSLDSLTAGQADETHLEIAGLALKSGGASLQASLSAQSADDSINFESDISVAPLALRQVLSEWAIELPDLPDPQALQQASLELSIKGSNEQLSIRKLQLALDDITINGSSDISFGPTRSLTLQLHSSAIDLNPYTSSTDEGATDTTQASPATKAEPTLIFAPLVAPLLWVGDGNAALDISLDGLTIDNVSAEKVQLKIQAANNILQIKQLTAQVFEGDIKATATINLQRKEPRVNFTTTVSGLAVDKALIATTGEAAVTGTLAAKLQGKTRGNNVEQLHQHVNANGEINLSKPYLTTFNVEKSYCDIAALIEKTPRSADWPPGSQLQDVQADIHLSGKQVLLERYTTGLGNISLSGEGLIDLDKERFDLLAISRLNGDHTSEQGCLVKSKRVRDKDIPIRCKDSFANAGGGSCKPDGDFVKQVLQDKLFDKIEKKSGLNEESEEALKGLLKGLFGN